MKYEYILAFDIGTSGTKTTIIRSDGMIIDSNTTRHKTYNEKNGYASQDPNEWWGGVINNTKTLINRNEDLKNRIVVIGVSGIMLGSLPIDAKGSALYNCIIHSDVRAQLQFERLSNILDIRQIYKLTGNIAESRSSVCKIMWLKDNEPGIYDKTAFFVQAKDYITSKLTGNIGISDLSDASHAQLLDIENKVYSEYILKGANVSLDKMPVLYKSTDIVGRLCLNSASELGLTNGIPVIAGGGDGPCSALGTGTVEIGDTYCSLGTTAWISSISRIPFIDIDNRVFNIIALDGEHYGVYGTVQSACRSIDWVMRLLGESDIKEFDEQADSTLPGSEGIVFLPYIDGERSPIYDSKARGVFFGLSSMHQKNHIIRAALEGVSFALRHVLDVFNETDTIESMKLIGGGAKSFIWKKIIADICNIEIDTLNVPSDYATSLGAGLAGAVGVGIYPSIQDAASMIKKKESIFPDLCAHTLYEHNYNIYRELYKSIKHIF